MLTHLGMIPAIVNGEYMVDEYGNVFIGKSWAGKLDDKSLGEFLKDVVRDVYVKRCGGGRVLRFEDFDLVIDGEGRIWREWWNGKVEIVFG